MSAVYQAILAEAQSKLQALSLPGITSNVQITKLPAVEEGIDSLPLLALVPADDPESIERMDFEGTKRVTYVLEIVAISKGKKLLGATGNTDPNDDLFRQLDWREQVRNLFFDQTTLSAVAQVRRTDVSPGKPVARDKVNSNYDYSSLTVRVITKE